MLRDIQEFNNELILNVYFYQDLLLASTAQNVVESWIADVLPKVETLQVDTLTHKLVDAVNLADPSNFYEIDVDETGGSTADGLPPHSAVGYGLRLNSRALRPGSKRYAGIPETSQVDGFLTDETYLGYVETVRIQQSAILLSGVLQTFQPIVVKRVRYAVPGTDPVRYAYRLPEDDGEFVFGNVITALTNLRVSHQVSRGNGR